MIQGRVVGEVWASKKAGKLAGQRLLLVGVPAQDRIVVAIDTLAARTGQNVLVAFGSGARNVIAPGPDNRELLCDAAIALLLEEEGG